MSRAALDAPRAPAAALAAPLYESHYLTAVAPGGGRALWLRYTSHKEAGAPPRGTLWCTSFDTSAPAPVARRTASAGPQAEPPAGMWAHIDGASVGPGHAEGALEDCSWSLTWHADAPPLPYLPSEGLYDRRLPRSNGIALVPAATFTGTADVAGERLDLTGWRGMVGHNWGADHADRWLWLHATGLGERDPGGWLDMVLVRVRVGPVLTPWLPAGGVQLDGELHRLMAAHARGLDLDVGEETLDLRLPRAPGGGLHLRATSPRAATVHWDYESPGGGGRDVRNCSVASAQLTVGEGPAIEIPGAFAVEVGG
jgi:hypothetical protein